MKKNSFLKKGMALALAGAMTFSLAACGNDAQESNNSTPQSGSGQQAGNDGDRKSVV